MPSSLLSKRSDSSSDTVLGNPPRSLSARTNTLSASRPLEECAVRNLSGLTSTQSPTSSSHLRYTMSTEPDWFWPPSVNLNWPFP